MNRLLGMALLAFLSTARANHEAATSPRGTYNRLPAVLMDSERKTLTEALRNQTDVKTLTGFAKAIFQHIDTMAQPEDKRFFEEASSNLKSYEQSIRDLVVLDKTGNLDTDKTIGNLGAIVALAKGRNELMIDYQKRFAQLILKAGYTITESMQLESNITEEKVLKGKADRLLESIMLKASGPMGTFNIELSGTRFNIQPVDRLSEELPLARGGVIIEGKLYPVAIEVYHRWGKDRNDQGIRSIQLMAGDGRRMEPVTARVETLLKQHYGEERYNPKTQLESSDTVDKNRISIAP